MLEHILSRSSKRRENVCFPMIGNYVCRIRSVGKSAKIAAKKEKAGCAGEKRCCDLGLVRCSRHNGHLYELYSRGSPLILRRLRFLRAPTRPFPNVFAFPFASVVALESATAVRKFMLSDTQNQTHFDRRRRSELIGSMESFCFAIICNFVS